jgi:hypothetical protein
MDEKAASSSSLQLLIRHFMSYQLFYNGGAIGSGHCAHVQERYLEMGFKSNGKNKKRTRALEPPFTRKGNMSGLRKQENKIALSTHEIRWNNGQSV